MGIIVGISGCSGSGKSTFANRLSARFEDKKVATITSDKYFRDPKPRMISPANGKEYEDFNTADNLRIRHLLADINNQKDDFDIVLVEGILLFCFPDFLKTADLKIFVQANIETRLSRRLLRNTREYGLDFDEVLDYYMNAARFSEAKNTAQTMIHADIIINGERDFALSLDIIEAYLRPRL